VANKDVVLEKGQNGTTSSSRLNAPFGHGFPLCSARARPHLRA
jgi:hypothetical protein